MYAHSGYLVVKNLYGSSIKLRKREKGEDSVIYIYCYTVPYIVAFDLILHQTPYT